MGDLNLDGKVDSSDAIILARDAYRPQNGFWQSGDFNYDGKVDLADATLLQKNFGLTMPPAVVGSPVAVPIVVADPSLPTASGTLTPTTPSDPTSTDDGDESSSASSKKHHSHMPSAKPAKPPAKGKRRPDHKAR